MKIGMIGFGQFGQFAAQHLKKKFEVVVSDKKNLNEEAKNLGIEFVSLREAASREIVIISVPINRFKQTLLEIEPFLMKNALVLDVCSVKVKPVQLMEDILPKEVEIIATHPLFGPQSGAAGIEGLKIVLCPIRTTKAEQVKKFLLDMGLEVVVTTPEEHDKQMALTQALAQFVGRALINMEIKQQQITVPSFGKLLELKEMLEKDSLELFKDIQNNNPFASDIRKKFCAEIKKINSLL